MVEGNENYTVLGVPGTVRRMMDLHKCSDYNQKMNFYYKRHDDTTAHELPGTAYGLYDTMRLWQRERTGKGYLHARRNVLQRRQDTSTPIAFYAVIKRRCGCLLFIYDDECQWWEHEHHHPSNLQVPQWHIINQKEATTKKTRQGEARGRWCLWGTMTGASIRAYISLAQEQKCKKKCKKPCLRLWRLCGAGAYRQMPSTRLSDIVCSIRVLSILFRQPKESRCEESQSEIRKLRRTWYLLRI